MSAPARSRSTSVLRRDEVREPLQRDRLSDGIPDEGANRVQRVDAVEIADAATDGDEQRLHTELSGDDTAIIGGGTDDGLGSVHGESIGSKLSRLHKAGLFLRLQWVA